MRVRIDIFEVQNVPDVRAAELIDALVVIADDAEVPVFVSQQGNERKLRGVRVLVLVDHEVAEALLADRKHVRKLTEEFDGLHDEVVEIHRVVLLQLRLVLPVEVRDDLPALILIEVTVAVRVDQLVLGG